MAPEDNKRAVREQIEVIWNKHQLDRVKDFVGGDLLDEAVEHTRQFLEAFPDAQAEIKDLIAEGDRVVARLQVGGTNTGSFAGKPPTGKRISLASLRIYRLLDGKIVESWAMQDRLGLMEQLGFIQASTGVNWAAGDKDRQ